MSGVWMLLILAATVIEVERIATSVKSRARAGARHWVRGGDDRLCLELLRRNRSFGFFVPQQNGSVSHIENVG